MRAALPQPGGPSGRPGVDSTAAWGPACANYGPRAKRPLSIALWVLDCESRGPMCGNPADTVQRPLGFSRALYLYLEFAMWLYLPAFGQHPLGTLSEGECE